VISENDSVVLRNVSKLYKPKRRYASDERKNKNRALLALLGFGRFFREPEAERLVLRPLTVSFQKGRVIGIAGNGGSGKSVLLKIISGLVPPSSGTVQIRGRLRKLLEIEDVDQSLTAQDVFLEEASAGKLSKAHDLAKWLEFAGLQNFADVPIRKYSTGMKQRLAMASVLCPAADVILIDDYIPVGDLEFQRKCQDRIRERARFGATVILVSNDQALIKALCDELHWFEEGAILLSGKPERVLAELYSNSSGWHKKNELLRLAGPVERHPIRLFQASVSDAQNSQALQLHSERPLLFRIGVDALADISRLRLGFTFYNQHKQVLRTVLRDRVALARGSRIEAEVVLPATLLAPGPHDVEVFAQAESSTGPINISLKPGLRFFMCGSFKPSTWMETASRDPIVTAPVLEWLCVAR